MIRSLLKLGIFLVIGILTYNYFFGTSEEKEQSKAVVGKVVDVGKDAWALLRSERQKFDEGKYDTAVENVEGLFSKLRRTAEAVKDSEVLDRLKELETRRDRLEKRIDYDNVNGMDRTEQRQVEDEWTDLMRDTEDLMEKMDQKKDN